MSTLWTPGGEIPIQDRRQSPPTSEPEPSSGPEPEAATTEPGPRGTETAGDIDLDNLSEEEREQAEQYLREMAAARERLKETPATIVVANHAMGLYELAALHLASAPPNFGEAAIAIDALGALLDGMVGRLGEPEQTLRDGLSKIRIAFVQLKNRPNEANASN